MRGVINVRLEFVEGVETSVTWHGEPDSHFTKADDLENFVKALRMLTSRLNKIQGVDDPRCKDCKHWGKGKTSINAWRESTVCFLKRKKILHPKFKDQVIYYAKPRMCKACKLFERKEAV